MEPAQLATLSGPYLSSVLLAAVRVLGAVATNPFLGSARVPMIGRVGLGLFITAALFPPGTPIEQPVDVTPLTVAGELLVGLLAGFAVTLIFGVVQLAGAIIGLNSGFSFAGTLNPMLEHSTGALESFFASLVLLVFVQINGHHYFLTGLQELFAVAPIGQVTHIPGTAEKLIQLSAALISSGVKMAMPVLAALLLADVGMAMLARVAPQLNLFALEMPVKMLIGVAALAIALPVLLPRITGLFRGIPQSMLVLAG